jgi:ADP-ribosylglycohydrolase
MEAAVWCLITEDSLEKALLKAANLGDDTDTVAAIAGGLAGLYYTAAAAPEQWYGAIQNRELVESFF